MRRLATGLMAAAALAMLATGAHAQDKRKVKIGTEGAYPPFNSIDTNGELVGFDVDIAKALCDAANFECEFVVQDWDGIIPGLIAKKYDAIVASMSMTEQRRQVVDFTDKYYQTPAKFVAAKGSSFDFTPEASPAWRSASSGRPPTRISCARSSRKPMCAPMRPRTKPTPI
jgi:ABC-type amino acid transport substrate-binding protein